MDFFAGCVGGAAGVFAGHPLDTVKVRLQTQPQGASAIYRGTWHCFKSIIQKEGPAGLYKGLTSPLASLAAINAICFGVHGYVTRGQEEDTSLKKHFAAGCAAGLAQSIIAAPSERLKLLIQIQSDSAHTTYRSPLHAATSLVREHGVRSLSRGFISTIVRDCPAFGIYFASYEMLINGLKNGEKEVSSWKLLLAGGGAGMLSWLFNYPTDVVKTRFQADLSYKSYWDCIKRTYAIGGWRCFFSGLGSTLIRAFPSNAATFFTVEWTYRILLDFNKITVYTPIDSPVAMDGQITLSDLWNMKCMLLLPEAGSTSIDPMISYCRLL